MIWTAYEIFLNLFQGFLVTWFITKMLNKKRPEYLSAIGCGLLTAAALSTYLVFDMPEWDTWTFIFLLIYSVFFFKDSLIIKLFWVSIAIVLSAGWIGISYHLFVLIYKTDINHLFQSGSVRLIFTATVNAILWLLLFVITQIYSPKKNSIAPSYLLVVINVLCIILIDILFRIQDLYQIPLKWLLIGCSIALIIGLSTIALYHLMVNYIIKDQQYKFQEQQLKTYKNQVETLHETYTIVRQIRHDINAYVNDFKNYAENEGIKEYPAFLAQLEKQAVPSFSTGNSSLDSVLLIKIRKIRSLGIEFNASDLHYTGSVNISDYSLGSLILNMLDNAIEALEERKELPGKRYITLQFIYSQSGLMILCENPLLGKMPPLKENGFFSRKREPFHGIGISIMERIATDAGGQLDVILKDDCFRVVVLIPPVMENEEQKEDAD